MHFGLSEEQELLQQTLRDFAAGEAPPARLRELFDAGEGFDPVIWQRAAEVGLQGLMVPERYGGAGLEVLDGALAFEVLGETALPGPFLGHALASLALSRAGSDAQRERWLPRLASGEAVASFAIAEAPDENAMDLAWDAERWALPLVSGCVTGRKTCVEHVPQSEVVVVGVAGGGLVLVESGAPGVSVEAIDSLDRGRPLAELCFEAAPAEALPGGVEHASAVLDAGRILLAADAFGATWKLLRMTIDYVMTREQFGTRIGQFQAVKHELANHASETEPMRGLVWYAGHAFDHLPEECALEACVAKAHVTERAVAAGRSAIELHGGTGFTWECDVQFWAKRGLFDRGWLGSPSAQRERVATLAGW